MNADRREWVRVDRRPTGTATVTVTVREDEATVKWAAKAYSSQIEESTASAREMAHRALDAALKAVR